MANDDFQPFFLVASSVFVDFSWSNVQHVSSPYSPRRYSEEVAPNSLQRNVWSSWERSWWRMKMTGVPWLVELVGWSQGPKKTPVKMEHEMDRKKLTWWHDMKLSWFTYLLFIIMIYIYIYILYIIDIWYIMICHIFMIYFLFMISFDSDSVVRCNPAQGGLGQSACPHEEWTPGDAFNLRGYWVLGGGSFPLIILILN